jgi:hypothetical protein
LEKGHGISIMSNSSVGRIKSYVPGGIKLVINMGRHGQVSNQSDVAHGAGRRPGGSGTNPGIVRCPFTDAFMTQRPRKILRIYPAIPTSDGAGVRLKRSIGTPELDHLDPFLMLDQFDTENADDYIAGFPDHPHRGFETVTYMIAGLMRHEDNTGAGGVLRPGGVQWMTAGRGIVHSEMPEQQDGQMKGSNYGSIYRQATRWHRRAIRTSNRRTCPKSRAATARSCG